uniref:Uncharacterized protein n=1 Tax=Anguilla anguilla TaxID=7936 RepID=A0A0E9Q6M6_ANGAN
MFRENNDKTRTLNEVECTSGSMFHPQDEEVQYSGPVGKI